MAEHKHSEVIEACGESIKSCTIILLRRLKIKDQTPLALTWNSKHDDHKKKVKSSIFQEGVRVQSNRPNISN